MGPQGEGGRQGKTGGLREKEAGREGQGAFLSFSAPPPACPAATFLPSQEPCVKAFDHRQSQVGGTSETGHQHPRYPRPGSCVPPAAVAASSPCAPTTWLAPAPRLLLCRPTVFWAVSSTSTPTFPSCPTLTESRGPCSRPQEGLHTRLVYQNVCLLPFTSLRLHDALPAVGTLAAPS